MGVSHVPLRTCECWHMHGHGGVCHCIDACLACLYNKPNLSSHTLAFQLLTHSHPFMSQSEISHVNQELRVDWDSLIVKTNIL
ncbi:hypothetical protein FKM82_018073 [Ascaphus truei]